MDTHHWGRPIDLEGRLAQLEAALDSLHAEYQALRREHAARGAHRLTAEIPPTPQDPQTRRKVLGGAVAGAAAAVTGALIGQDTAFATGRSVQARAHDHDSSYVPRSAVGGAGGVAELGEDGLVPQSQIPGSPPRAITLSDVRFPGTITDFPVEFDPSTNKMHLAGPSGQISSVTPFGAGSPTLLATVPGMDRIIRLLPTADGEMLAVDSSRIRRSRGWASNPATASWTTVLSVNAGGGVSFQKFGIDGDGTKFITTQYGAPGPDTPEWQRSRYVHISTDGGATWKVVWDTEARFPGGSSTSHLHAACYDPWEDRFWFTEGHGTPVGCYWSTNDGASWTKLGGSTQPNPMPTVMVATDDGIVCGTDHEPNGIFGIPRCQNPADMRFVQLFRWEPGIEGVVGFAQRGWRDPKTGLVWIGFNSVITGVAPIIAAGTATGAGEVWRDPTGAVNDRVWEIFPVSDGRVVGHYLKSGVNKLLTGYQHGPGLDPAVDAGRVGRGTAEKASSIAVGYASFASGLRSIAMGRGAQCTGTQESVSIGAFANVSGTDVVAVGFGAVASGYQSIAVGKNVNSTATQTVVIGTNGAAGSYASMVGVGHGVNVSGLAATAVGATASATATDAIAMGAGATVTGAQSVVIGRSASTTGGQNTIVGHSATSNRPSATALGHGATANHFRSVALGQGSVTSADTQVHLGDRHLELAETTVKDAPATNRVRLWAEDNGSGKTRLMVRFSTGASVQLAVEP